MKCSTCGKDMMKHFDPATMVSVYLCWHCLPPGTFLSLPIVLTKSRKGENDAMYM